ncbi:MAG: A/G-specific adenine glycosylase [Clostridiales bacterium]
MQKNTKLNQEDMALLAGLPGLFLEWYRTKARNLPWRQNRQPYGVWLSEIMLQQTRVEAVKGFYQRFLEALPDIEALAAASEEQVFKLWEGLGYYRRARNLHRAAQIVVSEHQGVFPADYEGILALPGIGEYTAGAVASICFGIAKPAVDGNVLRVMARLLDSDEAIDQPAFKKKVGQGLEAVMAGSPGDAALDSLSISFDPGDFNQSLMEIGAMICLPKGMPKCGQCPARQLCRGYASGRAELLPVRQVKKPRRIEERTVFILQRGEEIALCRRCDQGLLAGLWELPNVAGRLSPDQAMAQAAAWGLCPVALEKSLERTHVFSHVEWRMTGYFIGCAAGGEGTALQKEELQETAKELEWTSARQRQLAHPLPAAFSLFLEE